MFVLWFFYPTNGGHWWDMNAIRQAAAISIMFWGMKYLAQDKTAKFLCVMILALSFHFSSIIIGFMYWLNKKKIPFYIVCILLVVGFLFNALGLTASIVMSVLGIAIDFVGKYESALTFIDSGTMSFSIMALMLTFIYYIVNIIIKKDVLPIVYNGAAIYILLRVYMSFGIEGSILAFVVHRFETYFLFFYLLMIAMAMRKLLLFKKCNKMLRIVMDGVMLGFCILGLLSIYNYNVNGTLGLDNINYEFNFELF